MKGVKIMCQNPEDVEHVASAVITAFMGEAEIYRNELKLEIPPCQAYQDAVNSQLETLFQRLLDIRAEVRAGKLNNGQASHIFRRITQCLARNAVDKALGRGVHSSEK